MPGCLFLLACSDGGGCVVRCLVFFRRNLHLYINLVTPLLRLAKCAALRRCATGSGLVDWTLNRSCGVQRQMFLGKRTGLRVRCKCLRYMRPPCGAEALVCILRIARQSEEPAGLNINSYSYVLHYTIHTL